MKLLVYKYNYLILINNKIKHLLKRIRLIKRYINIIKQKVILFKINSIIIS